MRQLLTYESVFGRPVLWKIASKVKLSVTGRDSQSFF